MSTQTIRKEETLDSCHELAGKYLTLKLNKEHYGIEILRVQEIIKMMDITRVPRLPDYVLGIINLRGRIIPVVDLRLKLNMQAKDATRMTCIVVVKIQRQDNTTVTMGLVVDEVCEVVDFLGENIEPSPSVGASMESKFILGIAKTPDSVMILLDVNRVLTDQEISSLDNVA